MASPSGSVAVHSMRSNSPSATLCAAMDETTGGSLTGLTAIDTVVVPMPPPWPSDTVNVKLSVALSSPLWR